MLGIFGTIQNPFANLAPNTSLASSTQGEGLIILLTNIVRLAIVLAGVYTLFNIILAGYGFLSAGGDAKLIQKSWERIWRSFLGLIIVAGSIVIAGVLGYIIYGSANWSLLIRPVIFQP
jgi:hypothetical protein